MCCGLLVRIGNEEALLGKRHHFAEQQQRLVKNDDYFAVEPSSLLWASVSRCFSLLPNGVDRRTLSLFHKQASTQPT
jgi:hypothetical protein